MIRRVDATRSSPCNWRVARTMDSWNTLSYLAPVNVCSKNNNPTTIPDENPHQTWSLGKSTAWSIWTFGFPENEYKQLHQFAIWVSVKKCIIGTKNRAQKLCILVHLSPNPSTNLASEVMVWRNPISYSCYLAVLSARWTLGLEIPTLLRHHLRDCLGDGVIRCSSVVELS